MTPFVSFPSDAGFSAGWDTDADGEDEGGDGGNVFSPPVCAV